MQKLNEKLSVGVLIVSVIFGLTASIGTKAASPAAVNLGTAG